jgi:hypothetical protein
MYASMIPGDGLGGSGGFLASMLLLSVGTTRVSKSRPRRMFFALMIVLLVLTSQVGCDNGSVGSSGSTSGTQISTQTAKQVAAANEAGSNIAVAGLPIKLSTISVP